MSALFFPSFPLLLIFVLHFHDMKAAFLASALLGIASLVDGAKLPMRKRASSSGVPIRGAKGFGSASQAASNGSISLLDFQDEAVSKNFLHIDAASDPLLCSTW